MNLFFKISFNIFLKGSFLLVSLFIFSSTTLAQTFSVGHTSVVFYDSIRNRNIATEIYYPADNAGQNKPVSVGAFGSVALIHK